MTTKVTVNELYQNLFFDVSNEYFVQNTGTDDIELYVGNAAPSNEEGFIIEPKAHMYVKLSTGESIYAKTVSSAISMLVYRQGT